MPDPIDLTKIRALTWAFVVGSLVESSLPFNSDTNVRARPHV